MGSPRAFEKRRGGGVSHVDGLHLFAGESDGDGAGYEIAALTVAHDPTQLQTAHGAGGDRGGRRHEVNEFRCPRPVRAAADRLDGRATTEDDGTDGQRLFMRDGREGAVYEFETKLGDGGFGESEMSSSSRSLAHS